jgi:hypothetical protein
LKFEENHGLNGLNLEEVGVGQVEASFSLGLEQ